MANKAIDRPSPRFLNPVYAHSFPDPFVLKFRGEYFAYCTGHAPGGMVFGVLRSPDLVQWHEAGGAMRPLDPSPPYYWAPEVTYDNGRFYLYYSTGNETLMELRVAVSDNPDSGFVDSGRRLTSEEFAIDAHVFIDDDGSRYMFYATDFLEHTHIGTGTVVDRMVDWFTLEGRPRPVTRARFDWQVYDPARKEKGGVRWHTVEGPAVLKRKEKYFEMFSGGNWQNKTYGVSFAVADNLLSESDWEQFSDGEKVLPVLRTIPDEVVGPGHNSVVRGPNNRELYCIYHRWTEAGRAMAIDRMDLAGDRIFVAGPTNTPQPVPMLPRNINELLCEVKGNWTRTGDVFVSSADERGELIIDGADEAFLVEYTFRFIDIGERSIAGIKLTGTESLCEFTVAPSDGLVHLRTAGGESQEINLSQDFDPSVFHLIRVEATGSKCSVMLDTPDKKLFCRTGATNRLTLFSEAASVEVLAIELTGGFEELFEANEVPFNITVDGGESECANGRLTLRSARDGCVTAKFALGYSEFEFAANVSFCGEKGECGLLLLDNRSARLGSLTFRPSDWSCILSVGDREAGFSAVDLVKYEFVQLRMVYQSGELTAYIDGLETASLTGRPEVSLGAVYASGEVSIDMIRVTAI